MHREDIKFHQHIGAGVVDLVDGDNTQEAIYTKIIK